MDGARGGVAVSPLSQIDSVCGIAVSSDFVVVNHSRNPIRKSDSDVGSTVRDVHLVGGARHRAIAGTTAR